MVHVDTAFGHHLLQVAQTQRVGHIPPHANQNDIKWIMKALEYPADAGRQCLLRFRHRGLHAGGEANSTAAPYCDTALPRACSGGMRVSGWFRTLRRIEPRLDSRSRSLDSASQLFLQMTNTSPLCAAYTDGTATFITQHVTHKPQWVWKAVQSAGRLNLRISGRFSSKG